MVEYSNIRKDLPESISMMKNTSGQDSISKTNQVLFMKDDSLCLTLLLKLWRDGDQEAGEKVIAAVYKELKRIASGYLRREHANTLQTEELVNEAYMRLFPNKVVFEDRAHFFGIAARCMRQILVERARMKKAKRRDGGQQLTLGDRHNMGDGKPLSLTRLDDALSELESFDPDKARLVELRFFTGLSLEETAQVLKTSVSSVKREWLLARVWLYNRLNR